MIVVQERLNGLEADVVGPWSRADEREIRKRHIKSLVLNYAHGYQEKDLTFISGLDIERLFILSRTTSNHEPIYELADTLVELTVTTDPRLPVDLSRLPRLKAIGADWKQVRDTIGANSKIDFLSLGAYSEVDLTPLSHLRSLYALSLVDRPRVQSLGGLSALPQLRTLEIQGSSQLRDITDMASSTPVELESLSFQWCKNLIELNSIAHATSLTELNLADSGAFESLTPLISLTRLKRLFLHGSTKIMDGNLEPLRQMRSLNLVSLMNRRHYSPPFSTIQAEIANRIA